MRINKRRKEGKKKYNRRGDFDKCLALYNNVTSVELYKTEICTSNHLSLKHPPNTDFIDNTFYFFFPSSSFSPIILLQTQCCISITGYFPAVFRWTNTGQSRHYHNIWSCFYFSILVHCENVLSRNDAYT